MMASASVSGQEVKELRAQCADLAKLRDSLKEDIRRCVDYGTVRLVVIDIQDFQ